MKILIISDLHANYDALSALPESGDELWVLGDLVNYGPQPSEVVEYVRLRANLCVRGNHDQAVGYNTDPRCTPRYAPMADATKRISDAVLTNEQKAYLRELPMHVTVERDGTRFYLCHAKPSDELYGYCPQDSEEWPKEISKLSADVLLVGHTHTPFVRNVGKQVIVNPGSLGQPKTGDPDACYAVWQDGQFQLKRFPYDFKKTVARIRWLPIADDIQRDLITVLQTGSV